jgi:hypothetical protein
MGKKKSRPDDDRSASPSGKKSRSRRRKPQAHRRGFLKGLAAAAALSLTGSSAFGDGFSLLSATQAGGGRGGSQTFTYTQSGTHTFSDTGTFTASVPPFTLTVITSDGTNSGTDTATGSATGTGSGTSSGSQTTVGTFTATIRLRSGLETFVVKDSLRDAVKFLNLGR